MVFWGWWSSNSILFPLIRELFLTLKFESFYCSAIIICEGQTWSIGCSYGMLINIVEAIYGRSASANSTCNFQYNMSQYCLNIVNVSNTGCQLQRNCTLAPRNNRPYGSDPCQNKAKYLNMTCNCIPGMWFRSLKDSFPSLSSYLIVHSLLSLSSYLSFQPSFILVVSQCYVFLHSRPVSVFSLPSFLFQWSAFLHSRPISEFSVALFLSFLIVQPSFILVLSQCSVFLHSRRINVQLSSILVLFHFPAFFHSRPISVFSLPSLSSCLNVRFF